MPIWADINRAKALTDATYSDPVLDELADDAEEDLKAELGINGLDTNPSPAPDLLKVAAKYWTCRNIRIKQKHDGTLPNSLTVGMKTENVSIDASITDYEVKGRNALDKYISDQGDDEDDSSLVMMDGED